MTTHKLKAWPLFFGPLRDGVKTFEIRHDDRGFAVGDILHLREFDSATVAYTDAEPLIFRVTYITTFGQRLGWVAMAIKREP